MLSLWPYLQFAYCDRPGPPEVLGKDLDRRVMYFLKAVDQALASLNFVSIDIPKSSEGKTGASGSFSIFLDIHHIQPQMPLHHQHCRLWPTNCSGCLFGGSEGQIRGVITSGGQSLLLIQIFQRIHLVCLQHVIVCMAPPA